MDLALAILGLFTLIAALLLSVGVPFTNRMGWTCCGLAILSGLLIAMGAYLWRT